MVLTGHRLAGESHCHQILTSAIKEILRPVRPVYVVPTHVGSFRIIPAQTNPKESGILSHHTNGLYTHLKI